MLSASVWWNVKVFSGAAAAGGGSAARGTAGWTGASAQIHRAATGAAGEEQAAEGPALGQQTEGLHLSSSALSVLSKWLKSQIRILYLNMINIRI